MIISHVCIYIYIYTLRLASKIEFLENENTKIQLVEQILQQILEKDFFVVIYISFFSFYAGRKHIWPNSGDRDWNEKETIQYSTSRQEFLHVIIIIIAQSVNSHPIYCCGKLVKPLYHSILSFDNYMIVLLT